MRVTARDGGSAGTGTAAPPNLLLEPNAEAMWAALADDALCEVLVVDRLSRFVWCNARAAELIGRTPADLIGKSVREINTPELSQLMEDSVRRALDTGETVVTEGILEAKYLRGTFRPLRSAGGAGDRVLVVVTPPGAAAWTLDGPAPGVVRGAVPKSDPLAKLSPRELEVLALLGRGMSAPEAARHLHRSIRTVEAHRYSIGRKLKVRNQAELAQAARLAGLAVQSPKAAGTPALERNGARG